MASNNTLNPGDLRIGWYYHERSDKGELPAPTLLRNVDAGLTLSIPIPAKDAFGPVSRWFDGKSVLYDDDPDYTQYEYEPPKEILFSDTLGPAGLFYCRSLGKRSIFGGDEEGKIRVGFAVLGARSLDHGRPHRLRTYIPGIAAWTGLSPLEVTAKQGENGLLKGMSLETVSTETIVLEPGLILDTSWSSNFDRDDNQFKIAGPPFVESTIEDGADFFIHLQRHKLLRDLVDLAYWQPTGYSRIQSSRDDDRLGAGRSWREVITYQVRLQEDKHSELPLFYFGQIGVDGFQKWAKLREKFDRAIGPLMMLPRMKSAPVETHFIQSCLGLEGLGVQLARDTGNCKQERLEKRLDRIVDDIGFAFSEGWAKRTAKLYNDIKHYDRDAVIDPLDIHINLLENELVFRSWAILQIGLSTDFVQEHIDTTRAGQALIGHPGISFTKPAKKQTS